MAIPQAPRPKTTGPAFSCFMSLLFFVITVATVNEPALVKADLPSPPSTLVVYVHADLVSPDREAYVVQGNNGSNTGFGAIAVFDWVIREGAAGDSPVLGEAVGQITTLRDGSIYLSFAFDFNSPSYVGTITFQGKQLPLTAGEDVITGGTGVFRWARGYVDLGIITKEDLTATVISATLNIKYDRDTQ